MNVADLNSALSGVNANAEITFLYNDEELAVENVGAPHSDSIVVVLQAATVQTPSTAPEDEEPTGETDVMSSDETEQR